MMRKVVLVVEDNQDELMIYTTVLSYAGYTILAAADYASALSIASAQRPHLAIVDVNLGADTKDGADLVRAFRSTPAVASMPVIAHTAYGDVYRDALEAAHCDRVLHKPTNPASLVKAVRDIIGPPDPGQAANPS
jgi:two-component system, cell cycle response regulator DivK